MQIRCVEFVPVDPRKTEEGIKKKKESGHTARGERGWAEHSNANEVRVLARVFRVGLQAETLDGRHRHTKNPKQNTLLTRYDAHSVMSVTQAD